MAVSMLYVTLKYCCYCVLHSWWTQFGAISLNQLVYADFDYCVTPFSTCQSQLPPGMTLPQAFLVDSIPIDWTPCLATTIYSRHTDRRSAPLPTFSRALCLEHNDFSKPLYVQLSSSSSCQLRTPINTYGDLKNKNIFCLSDVWSLIFLDFCTIVTSWPYVCLNFLPRHDSGTFLQFSM